MPKKDKFSKDVQRTIAYIYVHGLVHYPELMSFLNVSRKRIVADLDTVSELLPKGRVKLIRKRNVGIYFEGDLSALNTLLSGDTQYLSLDTEGRRNLIMLSLLMNEKAITLDNLCMQFYVSRSTMDRDIKNIKASLNKIDLIMQNGRNGVAIRGNERKKRDAASKIISHYWMESVKADSRIVTLPSGFNDFIDMNTLKQVQKILNRLQAETQITFTEYQYQSLLIHICISTIRIKNNEFLKIGDSNRRNIYHETLILTRMLEKEFKIRIPQTECEYLNIHIVAAKQGVVKPENFHGATSASNELSDLNSFLKQNITNYDARLISDLIVHLEPALHRFQVGLQATNPYTSEIIKLYPQAFELAFELAQRIKISFQVSIDKNEIAYLALHFQAYLERQREQQAKGLEVSIVIVCSTGIGTARLLTQRINSYFAGDVNITRVLSVADIFEQTPDEDLIISTIPLELDTKRVIIMRPFFDEKERLLLSREIEQIRLQKKLTHSRLLNFINRDFILISNQVRNEKDAIQQIGNLLIESNYATKGVIKSALDREKIASTLLQNHFTAIPHAESQFIQHSGITMLINPTGISWGEGTVRLVFFMGFSKLDVKKISLDTVYHEFNQLISSVSIMNKIIDSNNSNEIIRIMTKFFE